MQLKQHQLQLQIRKTHFYSKLTSILQRKMIKVYSVSGWAGQTTGNSTTCRRYDRDTQTSQTLQNWSWGTDTSDHSRSFEIWRSRQLTREDSLKFIWHQINLKQSNGRISCQKQGGESKDLIEKKLPNNWIGSLLLLIYNEMILLV